MNTRRTFIFASTLALFIAFCALPSFAGDPPSRVARLNYMNGDVSMQPGGVDDWAPAVINRPITTADRLWTDKDSRAELHIGSAAIRMGSETSVTLTNLSDDVVQFELYQGTLNVQLSRLSHDEVFEIDTPNTAFTLLKPGNYRFDVDSNGDTTLITVWKGKGVATGEDSELQIESHRQVRFTNGRSMAHQIFGSPDFDAFDQWCRGRDERRDRAVSARYVAPDVIGYEDLDEYGRWREVPQYGAVWFPTRLSIGWEPYRYGHWIWVEPWGWTWVDDAPWGFAPFHYGRWVVLGGSWGWVPGPITVRPWYAPALVVWTGSGSTIGWFPLGYGEPYIPAYRVSREYFRIVNVNNTRITNITYVTNNYYRVDNVRITNINYVHQNRVTIVDQRVIVDSRHINREVFIDRDHDNGWHNGRDRWVASCPPVPPSRHSVLGEHAGDPAHRPSDKVLYRSVVMKRVPPQRPVPFDDKRAEIEKHGGRPLDSGEEDRLRHKPVEVADRDMGRQPRSDHDRDPRLADDRKDRDDRGAEDRKDRRADDRNGRREDDKNDRRADVSRGPDRPRDDHPRDNGSVSDMSRGNERRDLPSRVPRPPRREDDQGRKGGWIDHSNPDPRQHGDDRSPGDNRGGNGGNSQGNGNKPQSNEDLIRARQVWAGERSNPASHTEQNAPAAGSDNGASMRHVPRPPQSSNREDRGMPVQQAERSFPRASDSERNNSRPSMQQSGPTQSGPTPGMDRPHNNGFGNGDNQRHRPVEDRPASRPSYSDRGAGAAPVQQAERSTPRMSQPSESRPAMQQSHTPDPPRASEPSRSSAPARSSGGGNSGGSRGGDSTRGNSGHDRGNSHDHDSKPNN